jgi:hypothetical protein
MPEISRIEFALHLNKQCPTCKVLLFSGQAMTADLLDAAREPGHDFQLLAKPVHPTDLLARIKDENAST